MTDRPRRSALYMPASNARAIEKARALPCDVVILDLEDAVAPEAKTTARAQAIEAVKAGRSLYTGGELAGAIYFSTVLSLPFVLDRLVPELEKALPA